MNRAIRISRWGLGAPLRLLRYALAGLAVLLPLHLSPVVLAQDAALAGVNDSAIIDIDPMTHTRLQRGFSGVNDDLGFPVEYWDPVFNALAAQVHYGWIRFPGGASGDAYNWQTGEVPTSWLSQFTENYANGPNADLDLLVAGRGGARLEDAAARARLLGATLIVCVNAFTDTPASIGRLAEYVRDHHIPVGAWELANEAYLFTETRSGAAPFWTDAADYIAKMRPYAEAIRRVDPDAMLSIFADPKAAELGTGKRAQWDADIASFVASHPSDVYWDALTVHYYPTLDTNLSFNEWIEAETGVLVSKATQIVNHDLQPLSLPRTRVLVTEFDATLPGADGIKQPDGTLWGGIYATEFIMRLSSLPQVIFVGPDALKHYSGVDYNLKNQKEIYDTVTAAAAAHTPLDTVSLDSEFGFYLSAQATALSVLDGALERATAVLATKVSGGPTVAVTGTGKPAGCTNDCTPAPALYAMTYRRDEDSLALVITNKGGTSVSLTIRMSGAIQRGPFIARFVSNANADATNGPDHPSEVAVQTMQSADQVVVPPFSVLRVDLRLDDKDATD